MMMPRCPGNPVADSSIFRWGGVMLWNNANILQMMKAPHCYFRDAEPVFPVEQTGFEPVSDLPSSFEDVRPFPRR